MTECRVTDVTARIVETPRKPLVFVLVETAAGRVGVGEAAANTDPDTVVAAIEAAANELVGSDPFETNRLFDAAFETSVLTRSGLNPAPTDVTHTTAASALDVACWDLKGKVLDRPLRDLLGGVRRGQGRTEGTLPAYANGWWQDCYREDPEADPDPERFAEAVREVSARGFDAVKCNPFGHGPAWLPRSDLRRAVARVRAVREELGPDADVYVEGHRQLRPPAAGAVAARLESQGVGFYEEPTPPQAGELATLAAETTIPIATGESCCTRYGFQPLLEAGGVGVLQPDPVRAGGITELRAVAAMADAAGVGFAPHNACGPVSTAACAHLAATAPTLVAQEVFVGAYPDWLDDVASGPAATSGRLAIPEGPGLGVDLDRDALREHAR